MARLAGKQDVDLTTFVGRERDLAEGRRLLGVARLVTLVGSGGIGKTRLARRLADDVARAFPDGTFFVELAEVYDADGLAAGLAAALGIEGLSHSSEAAVTAFVRERRLLVVLDNCEHLVEACARLVSTLLQASTSLSVVATSRQPLGVAGEQLMTVEPLSLPSPDDERRGRVTDSEAVQLFVERARLVVPSFELSTKNSGLIGRLCSVLDGMPLAIELAAARLRMLSVTQLAERLHDRFAILAVAPTAGLPRHQTLRASVDWSFDLCSPDEQLLWARMSIFEGGADLDAAEAVCAEPDVSVFEAVAGLVDKSVLVPHEVAGRVRYRMLETIRDYGRERPAERGEAATLADRHRTYFLAFALAADRSRFGPDQRDGFARTGAELANIRAAFELSMASPATRGDAALLSSSTWWYWVSVGALDEGTRWADRSLTGHLDPTPDSMRALYRNAWTALFQGDRERAQRYAERALALADAMDEAGHVWTEQMWAERLRVQGLVAFVRGDPEEAITLVRSPAADSADDNLLVAEGNAATFVRGSLLLAWAGRTAEALRDIDEGIRLCADRGEEWYHSHLLCLRGARLADAGRYQDALDSGLDSLRMARGLSAFTVVNAIELAAQVSPALGDGSKAAVLLGALSDMWPGIGMSRFAEDQDRHGEGARRARELLGDAGYASAYQRGRSMTVDEAAAFALGERPTSAAAPGAGYATASTDLTRRELEVAELIARGLSNKDIAEKLVVSPRTAEGHVTRLLIKLGFGSRARVAAWVAEQHARAPGPPT